MHIGGFPKKKDPKEINPKEIDSKVKAKLRIKVKAILLLFLLGGALFGAAKAEQNLVRLDKVGKKLSITEIELVKAAVDKNQFEKIDKNHQKYKDFEDVLEKAGIDEVDHKINIEGILDYRLALEIQEYGSKLNSDLLTIEDSKIREETMKEKKKYDEFIVGAGLKVLKTTREGKITLGN